MAQAVRQREGQLRQALAQIQQMSLALKSVSTLAALYKAQLKTIVEGYEDTMSSEQFREALGKAAKLLAASHMEPVNEIIKLTIEATKDKALIEAQKNMISQMEGEVRKLEHQLRELQDLYNQTKKDL
jgi:antitoxin component HigA of HigAB toxin-antitoxin module